MPPVSRYVLLADARGRADAFLERRGIYDEDRWAISDRGAVLNNLLEWEWEPLPSSRDDEFLERTRFTMKEALLLWEKAKATPQFRERWPNPLFVFKFE